MSRAHVSVLLSPESGRRHEYPGRPACIAAAAVPVLILRKRRICGDSTARASMPMRVAGAANMDIRQIPVGTNPPKDVNAVIEIPLGGVPVKYEIDKESGALFVDRFLHTAMFYPGNYGFIPHTLSADGDPCDVLVVSQVPVVPGAVIRCRPVGALVMEDEAGGDEKILAVPVDALHPFYKGIQSYRDLPPIMCEQMAHFFQHYKDLEKDKWVTIVRWLDTDGAEQLIVDAIERAKGAKR
jgi:inorganic pyrophosphatase